MRQLFSYIGCHTEQNSDHLEKEEEMVPTTALVFSLQALPRALQYAEIK